MKPIEQVKIFIVEDNFAFSFLLEAALKEYANFKITVIPSGEKCIEQLSANPDVVLLDYNLEGMNGFETFKAIHAKQPNTPVIILSEQIDTQIAANFLKAGVYDYIAKNNKEYINKLKLSILKALK
jgi:two-component system OmpR family response regulator